MHKESIAKLNDELSIYGSYKSWLSMGDSPDTNEDQ